MSGKFGMFDTEAERDAFVAERDANLARQAERLQGIGIKDADDLVAKYAALCDLFEGLPWRQHGPGLDDGDFLLTSDEAREAADRVLEIMQGES
jgi:hypothetical protein